MSSLADRYDHEMRRFTEDLLRFDTTGGNERAAQEFVETHLDDLGFETYVWEADAEQLAEDPAFPAAADLDVTGRPSVGGVLEFGDPDAGPSLVLNGHVDVVPVDRESWDSDPFEPTWDGDQLIARGAADMKANVAAAVYAARFLHDEHAANIDGRVVVECVAGEEEGGIGAAAAARDNPYPFERDAAIVTEPTELGVVTATEGSLMKRLKLTGRSAHAATRWRGESVLPHFERIRRAFEDLEAERHDRVTHPLYERHPIRWPVNCGVVDAGSWASSVPATLTAEFRIGVAPGETLDAVEAEFDEHLQEVVDEDEWLQARPPRFERFGIQFTSAAIDSDEPVVGALQAAMADRGLDTEPYGVTYGADSRHYVAAGIPTVLFGGGTIDQAHFPNESVDWNEILTCASVLAEAGREFLAGGQ